MADLPPAHNPPTLANNSIPPSTLESGSVRVPPNTGGDGSSHGSPERLTNEDKLDIAEADEDGMNCLHRAAREGNTTTIKSIFATETGINIEAKTKKGCTALIISAYRGHLNCFKTLLEHKADLNARSANGAGSLHWAAYYGQADIVTYLLDLQVKIDHIDRFGRSALYLAAQYGHRTVVDLLLESGANVHITATQPKGMTALHVAAGGGHTEIIRRLIDCGADLSIMTALGDSALDVALMGRQKGVVQVLLNAMEEAEYSEESIALQFAIADGYSKIGKIIDTVKSHCPCTKESNCSHDYKWISQVIKKGGRLLKRPVFRRLLQYAVEKERLEMLKSLIDLNCDVNMLLEPASSSHNNVVERVRSAKVELPVQLDVNNDDFHKRRRTALGEAVDNMKDNKDTNVLDLLLEHKARINCGKDFEDTAFSRVLSNGSAWNDIAYRMLNSVKSFDEDRDSMGGTLLHVVMFREREDLADFLLERGADLEAKDQFGVTPFIFACYHSPKMVPYLLGKGSNVKAVYMTGRCALHAAALGGNTEVLKILLTRGLNVNARTKKGKTPLAYALTGGHESTAKFLIQEGGRADVDL